MKKYEFKLPNKTIIYQIDNADNINKYTKKDIMDILKNFFHARTTISKISKEDLIKFHLDGSLRAGRGKQYEIKPAQKKNTKNPTQQMMKQDDLTMDDQIEWIVQLGNLWKTKDVLSLLKRYYALSDHSKLDKNILNTANQMVSSLLQSQQAFLGI